MDLSTLEKAHYTVEGDAFICHNGDRYCNRPLYCNHIYAIALAGDKPYAVLGSNKEVLGDMMFALVRKGKGTWLQNASAITSIYRPGRMEWSIQDASWGATVVHLEEVPAAQGPGLFLRLRLEGASPGDALVWTSGSARKLKQSVLWEYDMTSQKNERITRGFGPEDCQGNVVQIDGSSWTLQASAEPKSAITVGRCSADSKIVIADADVWPDPSSLMSSKAPAHPVACGSVSVSSNQDIYWSLLGPGSDAGKSPSEGFAAGMQREEAMEKRVTVDTPDPWLNAAVGTSVNVEDACFRDKMYTHSGMRWGVALLGWRTVFGGTVFGSHDNVKTEAAYCIAKQIKQSPNTAPVADPKAGLASQAPDSRMFGVGRVDSDQPHHYDMQSQFFDQIQHAWRWTGDAELETLLRPALDLHCQYIKDCFDPDGDGIYESYANTWPTDDQWYNGGGTSEETAYAYRAESTALQLAQRAGDPTGIQLHQAAMARIRKGFFDLLWSPASGHPGAYREQGGLNRLHESCWLYAIFCPIDAGLLSLEQSAESLQYTESGLERVRMPYGGEQCWPSNWVPSIWSVREMWSGDNYQLALAYFQTGLADDGWKVLRGTFPQQLLFGPVPGDMGHPAGGTDFNDCNSMFARAVVEGLFGYRPDYPNAVVKIAPQFPADWDHASIKTPDMSLGYRKSAGKETCKVTLTQACALEMQIPVSAKKILTATANGKPVKWELLPGFGQSLVNIDIPATSSAEVVVTYQGALPKSPAESLSGNAGDPVSLKIEAGPMIDFHDPQGVLQNAKLENGTITGALSSNAGDHVVFGLAKVGETTQWHMFKIHLTDTKADEAHAAKTEMEVPKDSTWAEVPLDPILNGDIRAIYQQQYLSPRPNTCSLRLATDGYSTWQMVLAKNNKAPEIDLDNIKSLSDRSGHIVSDKSVPFLWPAGSNNIAFTSRWDNWPKQVEIPIRQGGDAVWFLLSGTTNPMEVRIPNAELQMKYSDGVVETLPLIPPYNFWSLCPFGGVDYDYQRDGFALPKVPPDTLQLGKNCRAMVLGWRLRKGVTLQSVTLTTLSQQVVIGLMGITLMNPASPLTGK